MKIITKRNFDLISAILFVVILLNIVQSDGFNPRYNQQMESFVLVAAYIIAVFAIRRYFFGEKK
jgi:hypothetical protein